MQVIFIRLSAVAMCQSVNAEAQAVGLVWIHVYCMRIAPACPILQLHMPCMAYAPDYNVAAVSLHSKISQRDYHSCWQ